MSVKLGLETFLHGSLDLVRGERVGILLNPSSTDSRLELSLRLLYENPGIELTTVFGPQHGARGETQDNMVEWEDYRDPLTNCPVHSLYGQTRKPTDRMLSNLDVLLFDIQDVGTRCYTYISTMALAMEACREHGKRFVVLDRPNPLNGVDLEGPILNADFRSFVGLYPIPIRHAMTPGELALFFNRECGINCELDVVKMKGWTREMFFEDTRLPWVLPSPNIPTVQTALVYPGMSLLEGTNISEGRGTTRPFEFSGAPWVHPHQLAERLEEMELPGAKFRPVHFIPTFHKWSQQLIGGVQIHILDRSRFRPFRTGLALVKFYREMGADQFQWKTPPYEYEYDKLPFDILCGTDQIRRQIEDGRALNEIEHSWETDLQSFRKIRESYLLY